MTLLEKAWLPYIFAGAIKNWITRDKKWCEEQKITFKRIWENELGLYKDCCESDYIKLK